MIKIVLILASVLLWGPIIEAQTPESEESCLKETTLKVAHRDLIITLPDAERIRVTVQKYLKTNSKPKPSVAEPGEAFIDCRGTVRMGQWILESSVFSAEPELRLTLRIHNGDYLIVRREVRLQETEGKWNVVGDAPVTYHLRESERRRYRTD